MFYCGVWGLPPEDGEWNGKESLAKCKPWLCKNCPFVYEVHPEWEVRASAVVAAAQPEARRRAISVLARASTAGDARLGAWKLSRSRKALPL